jgi:phosphatidylinositol glycan class S
MCPASSASNDPVLHFILFVPSSSRRPLRILDALNHPIPSSAFILPQWGGIILYNPPSDLPYHVHMSPSHLEPVISTFRRQLSALLGIPELPSGVVSIDSGSLSAWQLDALLRHRALENVQGSTETLQSIVKLVDQIKNMPVKQDVRGDIQDALTAFEMVGLRDRQRDVDLS